VTELEAVNILLSVIGEAPIESLATALTNEVSDSALARRTLAEVDRDVQAEGWSWNTDQCVEFVLTNDRGFVAPANTLRVRFPRGRIPSGELVMRGRRVWDRVRQTYTFPDTESLMAEEVVFQLQWDDLPHAAQQYVVIRSARIYASRFINSSVIFSYTVQDEQYARAMLMRDEETREQNNMLWGNHPHGLGYMPARGRHNRLN
jgi:hypothetical protein